MSLRGLWEIKGSWAEATAPPVVPPVGTVTIGTITPTQTTAQVAFTYDDSDQTGFRYRLDGGAAQVVASSPIQLTGLTADTAYTVEVLAYNDDGDGTWSTSTPFTTEAVVVAPPAGTVTIGSISTTQTQATVNFVYNNTDQTGFRYRVNGGSKLLGTDSPLILTGLTDNTAYTVEILAYNDDGESAWSTTGNFTTLVIIPPGTEDTFSAGAGDKVTLNSSATVPNKLATIFWRQLEGPTVRLSRKQVQYPTFTAGDYNSQETLVFEVTLTDVLGNVATGTVTGTVESFVPLEVLPAFLEVTLADISNKDHSVNSVGNTHHSHTVKVTDHAIPNAMFNRASYRQPWKSYFGSTQEIYPVGTLDGLPIDTAVDGNTMNIVYPNWDYIGDVVKAAPTGTWHSAAIFEDPAKIPDVTLLHEPHVDGELVRMKWSTVNPAKGEYDFAVLHQMKELAELHGKDFSIAIADAFNAPAWVIAESATFDYPFQFTKDDPPVPIIRTAPLVWDVKYLEYKKDLIDALGAEVDDVPNLKLVYFTSADMTNGVERHWRVDEADYIAAGYTFAKALQAGKDVFDMFAAAFIKTKLAMEGHTVFGSIDLFEQLYDYGFSQIGTRLGIGNWWQATRIALNLTGNEADAAAWPVSIRAYNQGSFIMGQTVGKLSDNTRFDEDALGVSQGWTLTETYTNETDFFVKGINADGVKATVEFWTSDLKDPIVIDLLP